MCPPEQRDSICPISPVRNNLAGKRILFLNADPVDSSGRGCGLSQRASRFLPAQAKLATNDVRETPRGALLGYLDACRQEDYRRAASFLNIRKEHRRSNTPEALALQLKQILDRELLQDPSAISNTPEGDLTDGLEPQFELIGTVKQENQNVDLLLERVQLPEIGDSGWSP